VFTATSHAYNAHINGVSLSHRLRRLGCASGLFFEHDTYQQPGNLNTNPHQKSKRHMYCKNKVTDNLLAQMWLHVLGFYPHAPATNEETLERYPGFNSNC
jgi:hypothetical protein